MKYIYMMVLVCSFLTSQAQLFSSRVGHLNIQSNNNVKNVEADNYQIASSMNLENGDIKFQGLLKSFEFRLGAIDRVYNSESINVNEYPKIRFDGTMKGHENVDVTTYGEHKVTVKGFLYIWDERRMTEATGTLYTTGDGQVLVNSDFVMKIEEGSMNKLNALIKEKVPSALNISTSSLGVSQDINVSLDVTYNPK